MVQSTERPDGCRTSNHHPVLSCAAAISVPTHRVEARDLLGGNLLTELCFLDQSHINSVAYQGDCKLVSFCSPGITVPLLDTELMEGKVWGSSGLRMGELDVTADGRLEVLEWQR